MNAGRIDTIFETAYKEIEQSLEEASKLRRRNPIFSMVFGALFAVLIFVFMVVAISLLK